MFDPLDAHYKMVIKAITDGLVILFLGTGVNLCDRPATADLGLRRAFPESLPFRDGAPGGLPDS
jgi:hypothetical protein